MPNRTMFVVLAMILCAAFAQGADFRVVGNTSGELGGPAFASDVQVAVTSPTTHALPGPVPVTIVLSNIGDVRASVQRLDVTIKPSGYADSKQDISVPIGLPLMVSLSQWTAPANGQETCTAWITDTADANHSNDTVVVIVQCGTPGVSGDAGTPSSRPAGLLTSTIAHTRCGVNHVGPADVILYDVRGRVAATYSLGANDSYLDLRSLSTGVYLARVDSGQSSAVQKLVIQR